ncbi:MAG: hypothetical protein R6V58_11575 [Planctomycetota bacterium]
MTRLGILVWIVLQAGLAPGADEPPPKKRDPDNDKVHPAAYRIRVERDEETTDKLREELRQAVRRAMEQRRRRLELSREEVERDVERELEQFKEEIEAIRKAREKARKARARDEADLAERWDELAEKRAERLRALARRLPSLENTLLDMALADWRAARRKERRVAARALERLNALLAEIEARERAEAERPGKAPILPPHE